MLAKTYSCGFIGLDSFQVQIEVDAGRGLPATIIVGLPDNAVKESKERVRSAIKNSAYKYALGRLTINLSPANTKKEGPAFDLAIAAGILAATEQIHLQHLNDYIILGELSLDGRVQPVQGVLSAALSLPHNTIKGLIVPKANAQEAALAETLPIFPVETLNQFVEFIENPTTITAFSPRSYSQQKKQPETDMDFHDVKGQLFVKRALEVAAAGAHNCLLIGSPGTGKSMLAKRLPTILPDMTHRESLETTKIHSVAGLLPHGKKTEALLTQRPFRSPHHTTSAAAIIGGGSDPRPGEVTLSHNGILFLDELPEFSRMVLESLRQPLEDQTVTIARAKRTLRFPARFMLTCAMNPCPCGFYTDQHRSCQCTPQQIQRYISKISGPLLDRIDLHIDVPSLPSRELIQNSPPSESSANIKIRTLAARRKQWHRLRDEETSANGHMTARQTKKFCKLSKDAQSLLEKAIDELHLSARAYDKILKISLTIADLEGLDIIESQHLAEAIQYRSLDRLDWYNIS